MFLFNHNCKLFNAHQYFYNKDFEPNVNSLKKSDGALIIRPFINIWTVNLANLNVLKVKARR